MPKIIAASDVGLVLLPAHPWWRFQCPTKLIELLALGKPVVSSNTPGIRWITNHTLNVVFLEDVIMRISPESFRRAILRALSHRDKDIVLKARSKIVRRFSAKQNAFKLHRLLTSIPRNSQA